MNDQAAALRGRVNGMTEKRGNRSHRARVLAVVSGKGGVGKSNFTVNFALGLQQAGKKVLMIDLDIGMANIDILLGATADRSIVDMLKEELSIWSIIEPGPKGLSYIAGGSGLNDLFEFDRYKADYFYAQLAVIESAYDYIFLDMGAGVNGNSAYFLFAAHEVFLVTTPEPTAITDAYAMVKYIDQNDENLPVRLIVNRAQTKQDGRKTADNMINVTEKFLSKTIAELAIIADDKAVSKAVRSQTPFLLHAPKSKPSQQITAAVNDYCARKTVENSRAEQSFLHKLRSLMKSDEAKR
ncbi:MinD/ParA family protein [Salisediminibacterium halotolerans]|uniref:Flagellar biosynthesis protein FlhG n=1 Tax=Salisediminibacterium halotolerans TaxID=517425 RepID=A0A1H9Q609_9BACI|nr:MinD/ParA family protein [Salisediminibacterium haloalkalitolerans]SER55877.1 flagellar biosynthesis protein FlhG [Salisediminibacterium haloalkalitolerans]